MDTKKKNTKPSVNVIPVTIQISADIFTPVSTFMRLRKTGKCAFFFESVQGEERIGRYTFLGINPFATLRIREGKLIVNRNDTEQIISGHPFKNLAEYLSQFHAEKSDDLPPFCGGAVGYVGYECIHYIEELPPNKADIIRDDAHLMLFKNVIAFDKVKDRVTVICNILTDEETYEEGLKRAQKEAQNILETIREQKVEAKPFTQHIDDHLPPTLPPAVCGRDKYMASVKKIKQYIRSGDIFQCVLSDRFTVPSHSDPFSIYRSLRTLCPSPYMFYLDMEDSVLLGASPEMLVKVAKGKVETCPIAGTRPRGKNRIQDKIFERDLLASTKEKAEHLMLVDLGRNDIGKISRPGTVSVDNFMQVQRFSNVMHLVSLVSGKIKPNRNAWEALLSCFPAGTLSGAPKIRAMEIISELEPVARGPYGGAIVYNDFSGSFDSCITIRSIYIKDHKAYIQAGAGIVADSSPSKEYDECLHKSRSARQAIMMAERGL